jgi:hypothetical protein
MLAMAVALIGHHQVFLECSMPITTALSTRRNSTRRRMLCGNSTATMTVVSRPMKCVRVTTDNADPTRVRANRNAMATDRKRGQGSRPALTVHAAARVAMISALVHLVIGSNGVIRIAVLVPSGSRSGTHGCAMIAPQQVLVQWVRVSTRCVVNAVRRWSHANSLLHRVVRKAGRPTFAARNLRVPVASILRVIDFSNVHLGWVMARNAVSA